MGQTLLPVQNKRIPDLHINEGFYLVPINLKNYMAYQSDEPVFSMVDSRELPVGILLQTHGILTGQPRIGTASLTPYHVKIAVSNRYGETIIRVKLFVHKTITRDDYVDLDNLIDKETLRRIEHDISQAHRQHAHDDISLGARRPEHSQDSQQASNALLSHPILAKRQTQKTDGMPPMMTNDTRSNPDAMEVAKNEVAPENRPSLTFTNDLTLNPSATPGSTPRPG